ncbi:MAG: hypothetical protein KDK30_17175, partial [Leptospiraceae bacterium]|nr:hypothetical protein [Leptospiraceae bacterium]
FLLSNRQKEFLVLDREDILDLFATTDPYKSQTFDQLLYGYRAIQAEASEVGDLSMHYGHAYALIKKNVEKEAFYDRIQSNGVRLPADLLRDKKKEILRDFKNAEYLLQYILNVNPLHVDAYLLLGWLHQYIDERRNVRLEIEPSYIEQVYEYFTGTSQQPTDGRFYSEIYLIYFPDNLYEGNIELYRQALEKVSGADPEPLQLASLNLNLANNYFKLLNFKRAINHYEEVERLRNVAGKSPFNGYAQRALFHFNLGRALFYEDRPAEGARHLLEAYQIYDEFERKPLHEQFSTLRFIMYSRDTSEYGPEIDRKLIRQKLEDLTAKSDEVRTRMSLIAALIGLAYWRAGDYEEAILFYRDAEFRLYKSGEPPPGAIDRSSLMNFIALAYQSMQEFSISDEHARQAGSYARDPGLVHYDLRYQPQTIGGRMLGCILDYGEDFSVIGEGRNPYGFSPLRQYELSLGIQLENMILKGDLDQAAYLLRQRRQVFQTLDIKLQLGRMGYVSTLNREALNYFEAGNFEEAANSFQKAAGIARKYNLLSSFRLNFTNRYRALFATFEQPDVDGRIARQRIDRGLEEVREFREQYAEKARDDFIRQRESEIPDYEFDPERDGPSLQRKINSELVDIKAIEATLYFYRARLRDNRNANTDRANQSDYRAALQRYDELLQAPATSPGQIMTQIRRRLNRAQILHAMGNLLQARRELNDIVEVTYEYNMLAEEWHAHFLLARLHQELYEIYNQREDAVRTGNQLDQAVAILREHPEIHPQLQRSLESFFNFATGSLIARNNPERALFMQEWSWEYALRNEYFRYPLKFENRQYSQAYDRLRSTRLLLARLNRDESVLRIQRSDFARVVQRKERLSQTLDELRTGLVST